MMTEDITRLCGEIVALREGRHALMETLAHGHKERAQAVSEFCAATHTARAEMAKRTKTERLGFFNNLKRAVHTEQRAIQRDLAGARKAWAGA
jgi:hypothetical protein